jgi:hypothetical protein
MFAPASIYLPRQSAHGAGDAFRYVKRPANDGPAMHQIARRLWACLLAHLVHGVIAISRPRLERSGGAEFFEKKIRPVLVEQCYSAIPRRPKNLRADCCRHAAFAKAASLVMRSCRAIWTTAADRAIR